VIRAFAAFVLGAALAGAVPGAAPRAHGPGPQGAADESWAARTSEFDYDPPEPGSYELPALFPAADGSVIDSTGTRLRLGDVLKGKIALLSLIYTTCSDTKGCPLATAALHDVHDASANDPALARNLRLVSLSFDPERDTPAALAAFAAPIKAAPNAGHKSDWVFLTTESERALAPVLDGFDQPVTRIAGRDGSEAALEHILYVYLIDDAGRVRNVYTLAFLDPRLIVADVRTLLLEGRRATRR
jgi:protein SCO1/2